MCALPRCLQHVAGWTTLDINVCFLHGHAQLRLCSILQHNNVTLMWIGAVVDAQNALTTSVLKDCNTRDQFADLMTALYDYPKHSAPFRQGSRCAPTYFSDSSARHCAPDPQTDHCATLGAI